MSYVKALPFLAVLATTFSVFGAPPPLAPGVAPSPALSEPAPQAAPMPPQPPAPVMPKGSTATEPGTLGEFVQLQRKIALDELRARAGQRMPEVVGPGSQPQGRTDQKVLTQVPGLPAAVLMGDTDPSEPLVRATYAMGGRKPRAELVVGNSVIVVSPGDSLQGWTVAEITDRVLLERFEERKSKSKSKQHAEQGAWFPAAGTTPKGTAGGTVERVRFTKVLAGANDDIMSAVRKNERAPSTAIPPLPSAVVPQVINGNLRNARAMQDSVMQPSAPPKSSKE